MAKRTKVPDALAAAYPYVARWVLDEEGWIEVGADEHSRSFVRALNPGGLAWEGEAEYPSLDAAFEALDAGIAEWMGEDAAPPPTARKPAKKPKAKPAGFALTPVQSSMLLAVGYDEAAEELEAVFASGAVWRYRGVPKKVFRDLLASDSKGSFMRSMVIDVYPDYQVRRR
jgi:hypothetical protein